MGQKRGAKVANRDTQKHTHTSEKLVAKVAKVANKDLGYTETRYQR